MSTYEDDIDPIEDPSEGAASSTVANGKRKRDDDAGLITAGHRREYTPEPDEELDMSQAGQQAWLVKIPNFLLRAWSQVERGDVTLAHVRVYNPDDRDRVRMELRLPQHPLPAVPVESGSSASSSPSSPFPHNDTQKPKLVGQRSTTAGAMATLPRTYALHQIHTDEERPKNLYFFREKEEAATIGSQEGGSEGDEEVENQVPTFRRRKVAKTKQGLAGVIMNEASARPVAIASAGSKATIQREYRDVISWRQREASKPRQSIKMLEEDAGTSNMLASGAGMGHSRSTPSMLIVRHFAIQYTIEVYAYDLSLSKRPKIKTTTEKFARIPKNELLDLLFAAFERYPYWGLKTLRSETQQPESYLRDVLTGIADLHRNGPYVGQWSLKETYKARRRETEAEDRAAKEAQAQQAQASGSSTTEAAAAQVIGDDDDDDDDDDDEDDFEEVI